jgi:hypothetical protein
MHPHDDRALFVGNLANFVAGKSSFSPTSWRESRVWKLELKQLAGVEIRDWKLELQNRLSLVSRHLVIKREIRLATTSYVEGLSDATHDRVFRGISAATSW